MKSIGSAEKCCKFTGLVNFCEAMLVGKATLRGHYFAHFPKANKDSSNIYLFPFVCRSMNRQYLATAGIAAGILLALHSGPAQAGGRPVTAEPAVQNTDQRADNAAWVREVGTASYYGKAHHGRRTASGKRFDQNALTAAHPWLPFGTRVRVTHKASGRSVVVEITDRLYSRRRIVDLSVGAARELGMIREGVAQVTLDPG
ncbi:MAG: septal ring lytic transglycosylase RlpA family protein [Acetobacteraceae bacterium]